MKKIILRVSVSKSNLDFFQEYCRLRGLACEQISGFSSIKIYKKILLFSAFLFSHRMQRETPLISVILTAHDRREFMMSALQSLDSQTLSKECFEVIVVKNFVDSEIDEFSAARNFKTILTDSITVGSKISLGVRESLSEYVTILEDDDIFEPQKLEVIWRHLSSYPRTDFVHNSYFLVDAASNIIGSSTATTQGVVSLSSGSFISDCLKSRIKSSNLGYTSCLTFKREIIWKDLAELERIFSAPDFFIILSMLNQNASGIHIPEILTKYRVHSSHSNRTGDFSAFLEGNLDIRNRWIRDYQVMRSYFASQEPHKIAEYFLSYNELFVLLLQRKRNFWKKLRKIGMLLRSPKLLRFCEGGALIVLSLFSVIFPFSALNYYYGFRQRKYYKELGKAT